MRCGRRRPLLPLREKVDRPEAEPDEGCSEERAVDKVLTALRFSPPRSVQHPSSDLASLGHLPPQGGEGACARFRSVVK